MTTLVNLYVDLNVMPCPTCNGEKVVLCSHCRGGGGALGSHCPICLNSGNEQCRKCECKGFIEADCKNESFTETRNRLAKMNNWNQKEATIAARYYRYACSFEEIVKSEGLSFARKITGVYGAYVPSIL